MFLYQMKNRIYALIFALPLVWLAGSASGNTADEAVLISRAEQAIEMITTVQADFVQVSSDGSVGEGFLYFRRPSQIRLDYMNPPTLTLVASSRWLYIDDKAAKTVEAVPISQTPLAQLLKQTISFRSDEFTTTASQQDGVATITIIKEDGQAAGRLDLEFDTDNWLLRRWVITDTLGVRTSVTLQNHAFDRKLANRLFGVPSYD